MSVIPFIPTNRYNVYHGTIVGHQHVKARSGTRKSGQVGYAPGGMDMGRTYPSQRIEYTEPWSTPEAWYVQLQRPSDRRKGWVEVDYATYRLPRGTYLDLRPPAAEPGPSRTRPEPRKEPVGHVKCSIAGLAFGQNISDEEHELWQWLSLEIKKQLERRTGNHALRIKGFHLRHVCPNPALYWGTIVVAVDFQDRQEQENGFVAGFNSRRDLPGLISVHHQKATFIELKDRGIPRTIELIVAELGI